MSIGDFPESLSRAILIGIMLVGRLAVSSASPSSGSWAMRPLVRRARPKLAPALAACPLPLALYRKPKRAPAYAYRACCLESTWVALPVSRYLSNAEFVLCLFRRVKDHYNSLHNLPLLKNTCVRQVVLEFASIFLSKL